MDKDEELLMSYIGDNPKLDVLWYRHLGLDNQQIADAMKLTVEMVGVIINTVSHQVWGRKAFALTESEAREAWFKLRQKRYKI